MVRAYVLIGATAGKALEVARKLQGQDGIVKADAITGEYDVIAEVQAADIAAIGKLIVEKVQAADGVFKTISCLVIQ
ncbi:MAG: Lrp/AsnC ligand binding domain-containing protein [Candidatus Dormibacteria bacterium]|jgi:DNA-binding Lrp family transcriptional regulator